MCKQETSFILLAEAAKLLNTTEMRVLIMVKRDELQGKMEGDGWLVELSSLQRCARPEPADIVKPRCGSGCGGGCSGH